MAEYSSGRRGGVAATVVLGVAVNCLLGCSPGIKWRGASYAPVHAASVRDNKLTLVYFRNWAKIECTEFEEDVLKTPEVREALRPDGPFYCVPLEFHWDRSLAEQFGVDAPPAVVIVDDDSRILSRLTGEITVGTLLEALDEAASRHQSALKRVGNK